MKYEIPPKLNYLSGLSWRLLVILGLIGVLIFLIIQLKIIVIPFLVALLLTALLYPFVKWLTKKGIKKGLAVAISFVSLLVIIAAIVFVFVKQVQSAYPELKQEFQVTLSNVQASLAQGPLNINEADFDNAAGEVIKYVQENSSTFISGLSTAGSTAGHVAAGLLLTLFAVIFLSYDGRTIWQWTTKLAPSAIRNKLNEAGQKGWRTLIEFVKSQVTVAGVDAVGIGLGALLLQIPLAIPIALIVFLGSFIPLVGAIVTGLIAVLLALVFNGWLAAVLMLGVVLIVQFVEGHLLQPFLIGKAVKIHPLVIVFAVATGSLLAGIPGALFAVPIVAVLNVMISHLFSDSEKVASVKATNKPQLDS